MDKITENSLPRWLQPVLWTTSIDLLDKEKDKSYIIHQVLAYGTLKEFQWLFQNYSKVQILQVFTSVPYKDYTRARFYFVKNYLFNLDHYQFNERLYVKNIPRDLRYRKDKPTFTTS